MEPSQEDATSASKTCPICGRVFSKAAHLVRHSRSHADEKPFSCSVCNKGFARTDVLLRHERTMHPAKRRRVDGSGWTEDSSHDGNPQAGPSAGQPTHSDPPPIQTLLTDPMELQGWYGERVGGALVSPPNDFLDMGILNGSAANGASDSASFSGLADTALPLPSSITEVISQWLHDDRGDLGPTGSLAAMFAAPPDIQHSVHTGSYSSVQGMFSPEVPRPRSSYLPEEASRVETPSRVPATSRIAEREVSFTAPDSDSGQTPSARSAGSARTVLAADTWESGVSVSHHPDYAESRPQSPQPEEMTSAEHIVGRLDYKGQYVSINAHGAGSVIPSMKFLDACIHLYFRAFHPILPVIHKPTFERQRASWPLLLSMCSIGCMFIGTQQARESGRWIHQRLHLSTALTRDHYMPHERPRLAAILSALLGQSFSFLYGQPQQMLTAEMYHEPLYTMARRSGLMTTIKPNPITFTDVETLDGAALKRKWREWVQHETFRRISLGITLQGAEATIYTGVARLIAAEVTPNDLFSDALFEAENAEEWRALLHRLDPKVAHEGEENRPNTFCPTALMAQAIVHLTTMREMEKTSFGRTLPLRKLSEFFEYTSTLAEDVGIQTTLKNPRAPAHSRLRTLAALWHYTWIIRLAPTRLIEEVAGRVGSPSQASVLEVQDWVKTPCARLVALHCGHILYHATSINDMGFLLPRVVFQATVVLLCFLSFVPTPEGPNEPVDVLRVSNWGRLVTLYDQMTANGGTADAAEQPETPEERYLALCSGILRVPGFVEETEHQMAIFSLRYATNLLLRRCTPWGIGATLADILSHISF